MGRLTKEQVIEHLKPPPGIHMPPYSHTRDRVYRGSLLLIAIGMAGESLSLLSNSPRLGTLFSVWTLLTIALAAWTFLVWLRSWRFLVRGLTTLAIFVWFVVPIMGWAFALAGAAIMAAKETHCFHFPAGHIIPWYALALGLAMLGGANHLVLGMGWLGLTGLWAWLVVGRWQLPLFEI